MKVKRNGIRVLLTCFALLCGNSAGVLAAEVPEKVSAAFECEQGTLSIDAQVQCPVDTVYYGKLTEIPFDLETLKSFFGEPQYWCDAPDYGEHTIRYEEGDLFENSFIFGSILEESNHISFEMSLYSSEEYEDVKARMKVFDTQQAMELMGVDAYVYTGVVEDTNYVFDLLVGEVEGLKAAFYSPIRYMGGVSYEYGDLTNAYFQGNFQVTEKEKGNLLSMDEIMDCIQKLAEAGELNPPVSGDTIQELELRYYLETVQGEIVFRPVWVFKVDSLMGESAEMIGADNYFYLDALNGELVYYRDLW